MNSSVRTVKIVREVSSVDFRSAMRHLTGGVSVITAGRREDFTGMTVTSVLSLSVDPPTLLVSINRGSSSWPLLKRYFLWRKYPDIGSDRYRRAICRQGRAEGRGPVCWHRMDHASVGRAAAGGRAGGVRLQGGGYCRTLFPRHRDRARVGYAVVGAHGGAGLLARAIHHDGPGRGRNQARGSQRSGLAQLSTGLIERSDMMTATGRLWRKAVIRQIRDVC
jgi:Flavin reductase like domain